MRWLKNLFAEPPPPSPILLRVTDHDGSVPAVVDVEITWSPSGSRASRRHRTAQGLCVVPWRGVEARAHVTARTAHGEIALSIDRDRDDGGRVQDLWLGTRHPHPRAALTG